jgi:hypothetical protein
MNAVFDSSSVADPGSGAFLTAGPGMNIPDHISESLETMFLGLNRYLNALMRIRIRDLEYFLPWIGDGKNSYPG